MEETRKGRCASGRARFAKGVAALQASIVVEYMRVDLFANSRTSGTTSRSTDQCSEKCSCQSTEDRANRTSNEAERGTGFGSAECGGGTTGCPGNCADGSAGLAGGITSCDALRVATGTGKGMGHISLVRIQGK